MKLLEMLATGKVMDKSDIIPKTYIEFVVEELNSKGCIAGGELCVSAFRKALETGSVDIGIFNKPLWGEIEELNY